MTTEIAPAGKSSEPLIVMRPLSTSEIASYVLAGIALILVMRASLLVALFAGLLVYSLIELLVPAIEKKWRTKYARMIAVSFLSIVIVLAITAMIWGMHIFLRSDAGSLHSLLQKLADIIESSRSHVPAWIADNLPGDVEALRIFFTTWLREHAGEAKIWGQEVGHLLLHLLLGMIIGSMVALNATCSPDNFKPFAAALHRRIANLGGMFHRVVFAQVQISAINTVFTGIYLAIVLPSLGVNLPLVKNMIAITFLAGLIPVAGNIISNTVIVIVGLSHSLHVAAGSLAFMVTIHKLEYFLNARIIGAHVNARAFELLTAILVMESIFGLAGVVAAPVFYAYIKKELTDRGLV
jgi:predicted PurR-regulated permease PerM